MGELTKVAERSLIVGASGCFFVFPEVAKEYVLFVDHYLSLVSISPFIKKDALISARIVALFRSIGEIVRLGGWAQIVPSVIKAVTVPMVNIFLAPKQKPVKVNERPIRSASGNVKRLLCRRPESAPVIGGCSIVIGSIYFGVLALSQWENAVRWVKRLDDSVSFHVAFHKEPPFLVRLSAALSHYNISGVAA